MLKLTSKLMTLLISSQLIVGCTGGNYSFSKRTTSSVEESFSHISGSFAGVFKIMSDVVFPSAMAQEGKVSLLDITDPNNHQSITSVELSGTKSFNLVVSKKLLKNKIIKLVYSSHDDSNEDRQMIVDGSELGAKVTIDVDQTKSLKSLILEYELQIAFGNGRMETYEDAKASLQRASDETYDTVSKSINADATLIGKLILDEKYRENAAELLAYYASIDDEMEKENIELKVVELAKLAGLYTATISMTCDSLKSTISGIVKQDLKFLFVTKDGATATALGLKGSEYPIGSVSDDKTATSYLQNLIMKFEEIKNKSGLSALGSFQLIDQKGTILSTCDVGDSGSANKIYFITDFFDNLDFSKVGDKATAAKMVDEAYAKTVEDLKVTLNNEKLSGTKEGDAIFDESMMDIDVIYKDTIASLDKLFTK